MFCKNCGSEVGDAVFCKKCGTKVVQETGMVNSTPVPTVATNTSFAQKKTKLGMSVGIIAAGCYFITYFGGYVPALLILAYVWLCEEDEWLKKSCAKAIVLSVAFSLLTGVIDLLPSLLSWIDSIVKVFKGNFSYGVVTNIVSVFTKAISIIKCVLFFVLGIYSLNHKTLNIGIADKIVDKNC